MKSRLPVVAILFTVAVFLFGVVPAHAGPSDPASTAEGDILLVDEVPGSKPGHLQGLAPGDRTEWAAEVTNTSHAPTPVNIAVKITGADAMVRDPVQGLQLVVDLCPGILTTTTTTNGAQRFTCDTETIRLCTGPAASLAGDPVGVTARAELEGEKTMAVRIRVDLPVTAGNEMEESHGRLTVDFSTTGSPVTGPENQPTSCTPSAGTGSDKPQGGADTTDDSLTPPAPTRPSPESLAITGGDILAALTGAVITTVLGLLFLLTARRRRRTTEQ